MTDEQELHESLPDMVEPRTRATRPQRYDVAGRCRSRFGKFVRSLHSRRLPGTSLTVGSAIAVAVTSQPEDLLALKSVAALAGAGIVLMDAELGRVESAVRHIQVDPRLLRAAYPRSARLEPHSFVMTLPIGDFVDGEADEQAESADSDFIQPQQVGTRYVGGVCDRDELRIQIEVLRQPLCDLGITIDAALDELCAGIQSPSDDTRAQCNRIVRELECCGLSFHAVQRSWRLPRAGVLLLEQPEALVRAYPTLAFFEPDRFRGVAIVDRPARAGNEVRQGLLF